MHDVGLLPVSSKLYGYLMKITLTIAASTSSRNAPSASFLPLILMFALYFCVLR